MIVVKNHLENSLKHQLLKREVVLRNLYGSDKW